MKKILILLLFFGFSYGQEKTLVGIWDCISCPDSSMFQYILKDDNSGYLKVKSLNDIDSITEEISWDIVIDSEGSVSQKGIFIYKYKLSGKIIGSDEYELYVNPVEIFRELFSELYPEKYNNGDVLIMTFTNGKFHMYERR
jgi:hypothetical protein